MTPYRLPPTFEESSWSSRRGKSFQDKKRLALATRAATQIKGAIKSRNSVDVGTKSIRTPQSSRICKGVTNSVRNAAVAADSHDGVVLISGS